MTDDNKEVENVSVKFFRSIGNQDVFVDFKGYKRLEEIWKSPAWDAVPYLGTARQIRQGVQHAQDLLFAEKVLRFFSEIHAVPNEKRLWFLKKIAENSGGEARAAAVLIDYFDSLDDPAKATLYGIIGAEAALARITLADFRRFTMILKNIFLPDLRELVSKRSDPMFGHFDGVEALVGLGLCAIVAEDWGQARSEPELTPTQYQITSIGVRFFDLISKDGELKC
ncbi:hypothetical protein [Thalassospira marina]|uniref:Uncharacterized protein n=1 Tax=Thalassospira marina TaxID=2048283 RepID=A0A2N3KX29_9PROT|nr:hypothetical protein [Thalassospira marina]PKR55067.1 hypothetical protein COO20_06680 [Thalassospira marina]